MHVKQIDVDLQDCEIMLYAGSSVKRPLPDEFLRNEGTFFAGRKGKGRYGLAWIDRISMIQLGMDRRQLERVFFESDCIKDTVDDLVRIASKSKNEAAMKESLVNSLYIKRIRKWGY